MRTMWLTLQPLTYYIEPVVHTPKLRESEEKLEELSFDVEEREALLSNLADAVRILDGSLKRPVGNLNAQDRV